eukprot:364833-Chlamydomonas_euryale.AAC.9
MEEFHMNTEGQNGGEVPICSGRRREEKDPVLSFARPYFQRAPQSGTRAAVLECALGGRVLQLGFKSPRGLKLEPLLLRTHDTTAGVSGRRGWASACPLLHMTNGQAAPTIWCGPAGCSAAAKTSACVH